MGLDADKRKLIRGTTNLRSLKDDLGRVMTPSIRTIILNLVAQRQTQINQLMGKINTHNAAQAQPALPLPEKKTPAPKATTVVTKKKSVDKRVHLQVK
jgi:hypothetical protein